MPEPDPADYDNAYFLTDASENFYASADSDWLQGNGGDDHLRAGGSDDYVNGGAGNDRVRGQEGDDILNGGAGNDKVQGGLGDDILNGGTGDDILQGWYGADTFVFEANFGSDLVRDFEVGVDKIDLSAFELSSIDEVFANAREHNGHTVIDFGDGNNIRIQDLTPTDLSADDFII